MQKKVKVMHLLQGLEVGGLENMVVNLLNGLNRDLYRPSVCCYDTLGSLSGALYGVDIHFLKRRPGIDYAYPFKLATLLKREKIDILHLHNSTAFFYGVIAGRIAGIPAIVYTEHARDIRPNIKVRVTDKILSLFTDRVIVVADFLMKNLVEYEWFDPLKITTIYNGIDGSEFLKEYDQRELRKELGLSWSSRIIGIVARLDPIKNHKSLIKAMQIVSTEFSETVLLVVGDGPSRGEIIALISECKLGRNVRLLGVRNDIPRLLSIMDVFVLCSKSEGLPLTLLEAMAAGKAIVATKVGGIPSVIEDAVNGLLIPPDDPKAIARAIIELLADKEKARRMGIMARKKFESEFTLNKMVKRYEEVYESVTTKRQPHFGLSGQGEGFPKSSG